MAGKSGLQFNIEVTEKGRKVPLYDLTSDINGEKTLAEFLKFIKITLVTVAHDVLKEQQARGFDKEPVIVVDGKVGKPIDKVNPIGKIEFVSRVDAGQIVIDALQGIYDRSKIGETRKYISSHFVFFNGQGIAKTVEELKLWLEKKESFKATDYFQIINAQPYARRLERLGVTSSSATNRVNNRSYKSRDKTKPPGSKIVAPNGTYFLTSRSIKRKYKRNSSIRFGFVTGDNIRIPDGAGGTGGLAGVFKRDRKNGRPKTKRAYLYPCLTIVIQEAGIK